MAEELPEDATLIMEVLFEHSQEHLILDVLAEDDGEEEEGDA